MAEILDAADVRDVVADDRDDVAGRRDRQHDREAFLRPEDDTSYGHDAAARRDAAVDREHSKTDRMSAAHDRHALTEDPEIEPAASPESPAH